MHIETIVVGSFEVNCYIIAGENSGAIVVDPGSDAKTIIRHLDRNRLKVAAYLLTHGHIDHIAALSEMLRRFPARVALHASDCSWAFSELNQFPPYYPPTIDIPADLHQIQTGTVLRLCELDCRVVATPGHTPGSVCYHFPDLKALFTGDTLFAGSVGRTDLPGGNPRTLSESLRQLRAFDSDTGVNPGHGPMTTIERERQTNYFMRDL